MRNQIHRIIVFSAFLAISFLTFAQGNARHHIVEEGQTIYAIARLYDVSPSELLRLNPQAGDLIRPGDRLLLPESARRSDKAVVREPVQSVTHQAGKPKCREMYQIQKKDNLFRLSQTFGVTIDEILAANPGMTVDSKLKKGEWLCIPYSAAEVQAEQQAEANRQLAEEAALLAATKKANQRHLNVAVVLPLKEASDRGGKMVEFYQGLLMAVDSVRRQGTSIDVYAYHSGSGVDELNAVLQKEELKHMDVVFGPVDAVQANVLNSFCQQHHVRLVMPFATTSSYGAKNPYAYVASVQASAINKAGAQMLVQHFRQHNVVIMNAGAMDNRGTSFVQQLEAELSANNISVSRFDADDEEQVVSTVLSPSRPNLIVLNSSAQPALLKATRALRAFMQTNPGYKITLFGYPEWTTYQGNILRDFHELDTYAYTTFFRNPADQRVRLFEQRFRMNFNTDLIKTSPRYGILGMDLGYYFLQGLAQLGDYFDERQHTLSFSPLQSTFNFSRTEADRAFVNVHTCFVHYSNNGKVEIVR